MSVHVVGPDEHSDSVVRAGRIVLNIHPGEGQGAVASLGWVDDEDGVLSISVLATTLWVRVGSRGSGQAGETGQGRGRVTISGGEVVNAESIGSTRWSGNEGDEVKTPRDGEVLSGSGKFELSAWSGRGVFGDVDLVLRAEAGFLESDPQRVVWGLDGPDAPLSSRDGGSQVVVDGGRGFIDTASAFGDWMKRGKVRMGDRIEEIFV